MGGGGLPIIFQHTGAWALDAYKRGAKYARGSRVAQVGVASCCIIYRMCSGVMLLLAFPGWTPTLVAHVGVSRMWTCARLRIPYVVVSMLCLAAPAAVM